MLVRLILARMKLSNWWTQLRWKIREALTDFRCWRKKLIRVEKCIRIESIRVGAAEQLVQPIEAHVLNSLANSYGTRLNIVVPNSAIELSIVVKNITKKRVPVQIACIARVAFDQSTIFQFPQVVLDPEEQRELTVRVQHPCNVTRIRVAEYLPRPQPKEAQIQ